MTELSDKIVSRKFALENGHKHYFTGEPCKRGHIAARYTKYASCVECSNVYRQTNILNKNERYIANCRAGHNRWLRNNPLKVRYQAIKSNAKRRGIPFSLELSDLIFPSHCKICKVEFSKFITAKILPNTATVDRVDSSKGYEKGNIDFICNRCNGLKRDCSISELERLLAYMRNHLQTSDHNPVGTGSQSCPLQELSS